MKVVQRVKNSEQKTVGFILENGDFINNFRTLKNLKDITNLSRRADNGFRANRELPVISYKSLLQKEYNKIIKDNPFKRDIQRVFEYWKRYKAVQGHKVLFVNGCRQIGKTTEIQKFAYSNYDNVIYIDISKDRLGFKNLVLQRGPIRMNRVLEKYCNIANLPEYKDNRSTVLIIDEIQNSKDIFNDISSFNKELQCDIIITGSYLGFITKEDSFFIPGSFYYYVTMSSLSFSEFCGIFNLDLLLKEIDLFGGSEKADYDKLWELYEIYRRIGGYPSVVMQYMYTKDFDECYEELGNLLNIFKQESLKFLNGPIMIEAFDFVFKEIVQEMLREKRGGWADYIRFLTDKVKESYEKPLNRKQVLEAVDWIKRSGLLGVCDLANNGKLDSLVGNRRFYFVDCGLMAYLGMDSGVSINSLEGILTETFVYSELYKLHIIKVIRSPNEDTSGKVKEARLKKPRISRPAFAVLDKYELDFMENDIYGKIYGIEVKTSKSSTKSLDEFMKRNLIDIGVRAEKTFGGRVGNLLTIPIYTVGCRFPYMK